AVLDKSSADLSSPDVLYIDTNGDGDLTGKGKRIDGKVADGEEGHVSFTVARIVVPGTEVVHTGFRIDVSPDQKGVAFSMKWAGNDEVSGGHAESGDDHGSWGKSRETAPVLRPSPNGPLSFAVAGEPTLKIDADNRLSLLVGNKGSGPATLSAV